MLELLGAQVTPLWPLAVYFAAVVALAAAAIGASYLLGQRRNHSAAVAYESGMIPTGTARLRFSAEFYLVAMFFVVFDLETVFIVAWALAARDVGWAGYVEVAVFIGVLAVALGYLWRVGALDWGAGRPTGAEAPPAGGKGRRQP